MKRTSTFDIESIRRELVNLASWWTHTIMVGGESLFVGEVAHDGVPNVKANKSIILTSRMLWFFSESAVVLDDDDLRAAAESVYQFMTDHFLDVRHGGVYWEVSHKGQLINGRKQIYAQSFAIYAFCAYYKLTNNELARDQAYELFEWVEKYSYDNENDGYCEAFSESWGPLKDVRLSTKDLNSPKTMNTHLHILEAYTSLYQITSKLDVKTSLTRLIKCYLLRFIDADTGHLKMFLSQTWADESKAHSFGHEIESCWLLWEALEVVDDQSLKNQSKSSVLSLAHICAQKGLNQDGSVVDLYDFNTQQNITERVWWVQAEAMVGFLNAFQMTKDVNYFNLFSRLWSFIQLEFIDKDDGEWHALAKKDQGSNYQEYKVGFWKGPYHNGRALMEVYRRLKK